MNDQPKLTQKERRSQSDARIIESAIELYARQGYMKTTLNQIGDAAGCTGALISTRYGSKVGLLRAVLATIMNRFANNPTYVQQVEDMFTGEDQSADPAALEDAALDHAKRTGFGETRASNDSAQQLMRAFIRLYLGDVVRKQSRVRALHVIMGEALGAVPEIQGDIVKANRLFRLRIANLIEAGIQTGEYPGDIDIQNAAIAIVGLLRGVTMQALLEPDTINIDEQVARTQDAAMVLLKPPAPH